MSLFSTWYDRRCTWWRIRRTRIVPLVLIVVYVVVSICIATNRQHYYDYYYDNDNDTGSHHRERQRQKPQPWHHDRVNDVHHHHHQQKQQHLKEKTQSSTMLDHYETQQSPTAMTMMTTTRRTTATSANDNDDKDNDNQPPVETSTSVDESDWNHLNSRNTNVSLKGDVGKRRNDILSSRGRTSSNSSKTKTEKDPPRRRKRPDDNPAEWLQEYSSWHQNQRPQLYFDYVFNQNSNNRSSPSSSSYSMVGDSSKKNETNNRNVMVLSYCSCCDGYDDDAGSRSSSSGSLTPDDCISRFVRPLMVLPDLLLYAYRHNSVLFLNLTIQPGITLEDFLVPPVGGINWHVPHWLSNFIDDSGNDHDHDGTKHGNTTDIQNTKTVSISKTVTIDDVRSYNNDNSNHGYEDKFQSQPSGYMLNVVVDESYSSLKSPLSDDASEIFHNIWRLLFTPIDHVSKTVTNTLNTYKGLNAPNYISVNLQGQNHTKVADGLISPNTTRFLLPHEAIQCATTLYSDGPVLIGTQTAEEAKAARDYVGKNGLTKTVFVHSRENSNNTTKNKKRQIKTRRQKEWSVNDFYGVFFDLYVLGGMSRCVLFQGQGSIGHLSSLISYDTTCSIDVSAYTECAFMANGNSTDTITASSKISNHITPSSIQKRNMQFKRKMLEHGTDYSLGLQSNSVSNRHHRLPPWLSDYFSWHNETKQLLNETNWRSTQFLILACFSDAKCGGFSDRIKPLPSLLLAAKRSKRLLLIYWERPGPLENWLVPPSMVEQGIDWRVPDWMLTILETEFFPKPKRAAISAKGFDKAEKLLKAGIALPVVFIQIQNPDGGESYYLEQLDSESTYHQVFHEVFRRFFKPVPRIERSINSKLAAHNMTVGQYASVHLRAMYGNRQYRDAQEMINLSVLGINCANNLLPGRPIFFASDSQSAVNAAGEYASLNSLPVSSLEFESNPLHLEKDPDWMTRQPADYDATFIDLLMLANSRCVAYSNGGYGHFGSLLSYDSDCSLRFFASRHPTTACHWIHSNNETHRTVDLLIPKAAAATTASVSENKPR